MTRIETIKSALFHTDASCDREQWVRLGMAAKSAGLDFDDFHSWSATASNYSGESECRLVWKSFKDSGTVTSATIFKAACAQGWRNPHKSGDKESRPYRPHERANKMAQNPVKQAGKQNAVTVWDLCIPATCAEAYIDRKQGKPDGLRVYPASAPPLIIRGQNVAGYLVVPCSTDGQLQTLQFIPPDGGDKLNLPGASFGNGFFTVGDIAAAENIYVVEGVGQAWAVTSADLKSAAAVSFGAGRMKTVAKALERYSF